VVLESLCTVKVSVPGVPAARWSCPVNVLVPVSVVVLLVTSVVPVPPVVVAITDPFLSRLIVAVVKPPVAVADILVNSICPVTLVAVETVAEVVVVVVVRPVAIPVKTTLPVRSLLTESHSPSSSAPPISCISEWDVMSLQAVPSYTLTISVSGLYQVSPVEGFDGVVLDT